MIQANTAPPSRWVLRALWLIALTVAIAVLTVRSSSVLGQSQQVLDALAKSATLSFDVPRESGDAPHSVDTLSWEGHAPVLVQARVIATVVAGTRLTIGGWAFDRQANAPFAGIGARVDNRPQIFYSVVNLARPDVAASLHDPAARQSGFSTLIDTTNLALGMHTISLLALTPNQKTAVSLGTLRFAIGSQAIADQKTDSIDAINGILLSAGATEISPIAVTRSARRVTLAGWAFITRGKRLANSVVLLLDGNPVAPVRYGLPRADVAAAYHDVRVSRSGFEVTLPLDTLPNGIHVFKVRLNSSDGQAVDSFSTLRIDVRGYL